jgi:hypothetical protein
MRDALRASVKWIMRSCRDVRLTVIALQHAAVPVDGPFVLLRLLY